MLSEHHKRSRRCTIRNLALARTPWATPPALRRSESTCLVGIRRWCAVLARLAGYWFEARQARAQQYHDRHYREQRVTVAEAGGAERMPHFRRPPVVEVALSIQFEAITALKAVHIGVFWDRYLREQYPTAEEVPALPLTLESFESDTSLRDDVQFTIGPLPAMRHWLISRDGTRLVQMQQDRLIVNWRRIRDEDEYPRYGVLREELQRVAEAFQSFVVTVTGFVFPSVTQTEVTYVNRIPIGGPVGGLSDVGDVLSHSKLSWTTLLGTPEQLKLEQRFRLTGPGTQPSRVYVSLQPAPDGEALMLNITMRGLPEGKTMADALMNLDFAHIHIVRGFAAITSSSLRTAWEEGVQ